mgnify:CR=1 FL=1
MALTRSYAASRRLLACPSPEPSEPTPLMLGPHIFLSLRELNWVAAKIYAAEVRRLKGWPLARDCLCPWLWEMAKKYWYD